ncbi:hypothetical protein [Nocardia sp. NPDC050710]|uniref:hypothetical protein n=1 Tax=Nocardia sp. NPDC050710 TaxID=3157220 RepID=UPI0033FA29DF
MTENEIWLLRSDRFEWVLYSTATGAIVRTLRPEGTRQAAGLIKKCRGKLVAFYVNADRTGYLLQSGSTAIELDGRARLRYWKSLRNYLAHLEIERDGTRLRLDEFTVATAADDPSDYVSSKDFLGTVYAFHTDRDKYRHGLTVWSQDADPTLPSGR